ncbi:MAG TPA: glycosyltransferase family 2 protein [Caulobacteraceae bacterium]|nr:glycosyltransferase family 2 protein [Caulobacteraceae bacterium]
MLICGGAVLQQETILTSEITAGGAYPSVDVSFVLPCLNEAPCLEPCIVMIREALAELQTRLGLSGEIIVADNGSTDGSQALAMRLGARVVAVSERGYGAALRGGFTAARGRFLVMGDADGSYDFREAPPMVEKLMAGADLCMGSRFKGGIKPGAMPWKNRYIGNPALTGILNLLFGSDVDDAHCGLRALTKSCFERLELTGAGMEFASEMVIKAALKGEAIAEVPVTLSPDLRDRPPHLRPWRDGWRHLRYLFMLSPFWLFAAPAIIAATSGVAIMAVASWYALVHPHERSFFGDYWVVLAGAMIAAAHNAGLFGFASYLLGVRSGYRRPGGWMAKLARSVTLETMLIAGGSLMLAGLVVLISVAFSWLARNFGPAPRVLPAVLGTLMMTLGAQNIFGGFILSIVSGHEARFLEPVADAETPVLSGDEARAH